MRNLLKGEKCVRAAKAVKKQRFPVKSVLIHTRKRDALTYSVGGTVSTIRRGRNKSK